MRSDVLVALPSLVFLLTMAPAASADPKSAWYSDEADRMFWFIVVNDSHIGCAFSCGGDSDSKGLDWVTGEAYQVIQPRFIFNCGDLVDGTNGGLLPLGQYDQEWSEYRTILDTNGMTPLTYVDTAGNHDAYGDKGLTHFLQWSIQGSLDGNTQHSVLHEDWYGKYHFLAVSTPTMDGGGVFSDNAVLDAAEIQFIEGAFDQNKDADLHFAFGHHGVHWGTSNKVGEGGVKFESLMKAHQVSAYFWGHTHDYYSEFHNGTLFRNTRSLGKNGDQNFTLAVVDHNALSVRTFTALSWPHLLITAPVDTQLGGGNPYTYVVPGAWSQAPVRAVVFSKTDPDSVVFRIDGGDWTPMEAVAPSVYQGTFDATLLTEGGHSLRVRANPWTSVDHEIGFQVASVACSNGIDDDQDGWTDFPADPGCVNPADTDETDPPDPPEPQPEPIPEPLWEPQPEIVPEPGPEPVPEPVPEPSIETGAETLGEEVPGVPEDVYPEPVPEEPAEATTPPESVGEPVAGFDSSTVPPEATLDEAGGVGGGCVTGGAARPAPVVLILFLILGLLAAARRKCP